ncbi:uncharacterized protein LOC110704255 isoform X2 [Chenopodium quinoa]|uniref:uncharacterized protein LOC110704255 isoform X2 n=1 Tax=Chenopodium quinoa TaxID=63459 RepID=UPI000B79A38A|nr:uncharacterized protein LOC110704255 isoform X2 [Chenopodium quinoa]
MEKDMDFHGLKRKELQSLCKEHGIPANLKNVEMADRLSALLKEEKPTKRGRSCLKNLSVIDEVDEELADSKEPKKVKFSPQNETFVFEKTDPRELRLLARKRRVFQKPEIEENPGSVVGNVSELGNVDDVEKPVGRNLRRRSVVGKPDAVLEPEVVEKPVGRVSRRRPVVVKPDLVLDAGVVDGNVEKPVGRVSRSKSVVVKSDVVLDTGTVDDNVEKPVGKVLRKKSVVPKPDVVLDTGTVDDNVGKPVGRVSRRKSVVVKPDMVLDIGTVNDNVEKPVGRVSRRKTVVVKPDVVLDTGTFDDNVGKPVERISRRKSVAVKPAAVVDDGNNLVERGQARRSVRQVQKVETKGRKTALKEQKNAEVLEQAVAENVQQKSPEMVADVKKGQRVRKPTATLKAKGDTEGLVMDTIKENVENDKNSEIRGLKRKGLRRKNDNVDKDVGYKEIKVVRRSRRQAGMSKVDSSTSGLMVEDEKVNEVEAQYTNESEATGCSAPATDGTDYVQHEETMPGNYAHVQSLSENREPTIDELRHATGNTTSAEKKAENSEETTGFSPNRSEKLYVKNNIMQLEDCPEDTDIIDKVHEDVANNESSMFLNSGKGRVKSRKLEDCPEETYIIDKALENAVAADQIPAIDESSMLQNFDEGGVESSKIEDFAEETYIVDKALENAVAADQIPANDESPMLQNCGEGGVESSKTEDIPEETYIIDKALENVVAADQTPANDESPMLANSGEDGVVSSKLDDCPEETNIMDKALGNAVAADQTPANNENSILQDSGGNGIKSSMQADKVKENSLNMISVVDNNSYEEIASTKPSNLKRQLSGEPDCHIAVEPSFPRGSGGSDTDGVQLSSPFGELEAGRDSKILESSDGLECFNQNRNEHFIEQENACVESPPEIENAVEEEMVEHAAPILEEQENECEHSEESASEKENAVEDEVVDRAAVILKEQGNECEESPSENEIAVEDKVVDNAAVILKEQEPELEESPSQNESAVDEMVDCATVILKESDVQPTVQEEAASLWSSCDTIATNVEQVPDIYFDQQQSYHLMSEEEVVFGPEADLEANAQSPNVMEGLTLSSNASAATLNKGMEEGQATTIVMPLWNRGIDCSSSDAEDSHLNHSLKKNDSEARTKSSSTMNISSLYLLSQVDGGVGDFSSSMKKGEESCNETSRGVIGCLENSIKANNLAKEDKAVFVEQVDEMKIGLEAVKDDYVTNPNDSKELTSEMAVSATKQDTIVLYDGEETPVSIHERKRFQVAHEGNLCSDAFGSISNNASECISVSDKTKCLKQSSVDAAEGRDTGDGKIKNSSVNPLNVEDREREMSETSCTRNVVSCFDVGSVFTEVSEQCEHNPEVDTVAVVDEHEFHLKHDDKSAVLNSTPQKDILFRLEKLCDNYFFPLSDLTSPSGSRAVETPSRDLTCFTNDRNVDVDEYDKYSSAKQKEGANFSNEPKLQHLFSGHYSDTVTKDTCSKDQESECAAWNTEDLLALGGEVEEPVSDPTKDLELIAVEDAEDKDDVDVILHGYNNGAVEYTVSDPTKDLELMVAKDAENTDDDINFHGDTNGEPAETSNNEIATVGGDLKSSSNEISENSLVKEMADPVSALQLRDNKSSADLKINHFSSPAKPMKIQTPEVLLAQNSSHFATQEKSNLKLNVDKYTAQTSNSLGSVEKEETGCTKEAEDLSICGNETPGTTIYEKLDEALEQEFCLQTMSVGSIKKNFEYFSQALGSFEGSAKECKNIREKESLKSNNETDFVEAVERGIAMQNSLDMSEKGKSDVGEEMMEVCSMVELNPVHNVGNGEDARSSNGYLEMAEKSHSPKRKFETFSLTDAASVLDNDAGTIAVSCTPLNKTSTCHSSDAYAATSKTASYSLQSSQNKCNNSLQNGETMLCKDDQDNTCQLHSGDTVLCKDDQDTTVNSSDMMKTDAENSDVLPPELATPAKLSSLASTTEMHNGPKSIAGKDLGEYVSTTEELQGSCLFGQEIINQEHVDHVALEVSINSESSPCGIYLTNSDPEHNVHRENISPAQELDSAKFTEVRVALDDRCCSADREANISSLTPPMINTTNSASLIARHEVLEGTSNQKFVNAYNVHEMAQEVPSTFTLLNQENDEGYSRGNSDPNLEETEGMMSRNESFVFTDTEIVMFWDEIEKEEASKLQTEVSDVTFSVNEYDSAIVEKHQPAVGVDSDPGEQKLQEVDEREERGDSADQVGDKQNCINAQENENSMIRRKNTRSILIHGTPRKLPPFMHDMKENAAAPKRLQMVGATAVKPRRKALGDVRK